MRATTHSAHKPVNQANAGFEASILNSLREMAANKPMLALMVAALAVSAVAAIVAVIAGSIALVRGAVYVVKNHHQKASQGAAGVLAWTLAHKRQVVIGLVLAYLPDMLVAAPSVIKAFGELIKTIR
jgi:hypothetical protein